MKLGPQLYSILMLLAIWICMAVIWFMLIYIDSYITFGVLVCVVFAILITLLYKLNSKYYQE